MSHNRRVKKKDVEIRAKIAEYQTSDAPFDVKQEAIQKLEEGLSHKLANARKQIAEGASDVDGMEHMY